MEHDNYNIDYSGQQPRQTNGPQAPREYETTRPYQAVGAPKRQWAIPSIVKTGASFLAMGMIFFGAEMLLPDNFKPSYFVSTYDARVTAAVKASELHQQAKLDRYSAELKVATDQNAEQYRAQTQAILAYYTASYERAKIYAGGIVQLQQQYAAVRYQQTQQGQGSQMGLLNIAKFLGEVGNMLEPGAGDPALGYADNLSQQLSDELDRAAQNGITIEVEGWDTNLPSPLEVQTALARLEPVPLPPVPRISEDTDYQDTSSEEMN